MKIKDDEVIINDYLKVHISRTGAETIKIINLKNNKEALWQKNINTWNNSSPILFPIVGGLNNNKYSYNGTVFKLSSHGFAKNSLFKITQLNTNEISLTLTTNREIYQAYPFYFKLVVNYRLEKNTLITTYRVQNTGATLMPFSIGAHPGLLCTNWTKNKKYHLEFECEEATFSWPKKNGVLVGNKRTFKTNDKKLIISHDKFEQGPIILKELQSKVISLKCDDLSTHIVFNFADFKQLGLWTFQSNNCDFICIEPWQGVDSTYGDDLDIFKKEGILTLKPNTSKSFTYAITIN